MPQIPASNLPTKVLRAPITPEPSEPLKPESNPGESHRADLAAEAKALEEILENQAHPTNLVAVRENGTPVRQNAQTGAPVLFEASAGDEFEILDLTPDWAHVRISGLSRGWIQRSSVEMSAENVADSGTIHDKRSTNASPFHVTREQVAPFPGDWAALRAKMVKIVSIQSAGEIGNNSAPHGRLEFARRLLDLENVQDTAYEGIVLIFDSEDGGMIAATVQSLRQWKAGAIADSAFWRQCFFDPPELLGAVGN